jgi:hypothetical protein
MVCIYYRKQAGIEDEEVEVEVSTSTNSPTANLSTHDSIAALPLGCGLLHVDEEQEVEVSKYLDIQSDCGWWELAGVPLQGSTHAIALSPL